MGKEIWNSIKPTHIRTHSSIPDIWGLSPLRALPCHTATCCSSSWRPSTPVNSTPNNSWHFCCTTPHTHTSTCWHTHWLNLRISVQLEGWYNCMYTHRCWEKQRVFDCINMCTQTLSYTVHIHKPLSLERQIKVELWAQEVGQMERVASLGHSITESMFVWVCVPAWEGVECACSNGMLCFHLWASRCSMCTRDLLKKQCIHVRGCVFFSFSFVSPCMLVCACVCECCLVWPPRQTGRWEERRPAFQTRLGLWLPKGLPAWRHSA